MTICFFLKKPNQAFITHSHADHCYLIPYLYSRNRKLDIYAPEPCIQYMHPYLKSAQNLNDCQPDSFEKFVLHGVKTGNTIDISKNLYSVHVIECVHTVPSVGYLFYERRSKLKDEYKNLDGKSLAQLRKEKVNVSEEVLVPLFAFLGDTLPTVFDQYGEQLFKFPYIITECTFLDGEQSSDKGHTHWSALRPYVEKNPQCNFVLIHFSCALKDEEIAEFFSKKEAVLKNVIPFGVNKQQ